MVQTTNNLSTQQKYVKSKLRVSINLPDIEISLLQNRQLSFDEREGSSSFSASDSASSSTVSRVLKGKAPLRSNSSLPISMQMV